MRRRQGGFWFRVLAHMGAILLLFLVFSQALYLGLQVHPVLRQYRSRTDCGAGGGIRLFRLHPGQERLAAKIQRLLVVREKTLGTGSCPV